MHFRFRGNPNTNNAGRLFQVNAKRAAAGLPPMSLAEYEGKTDPPAPGKKGDPLPAVRVKLPRKMF